MCVHGYVFGVCAAICETEDLITDFETFFDGGPKGGDVPAEFDAEDGPGLRWDGVVSFALQEVHSVEPESFNFYDGLAFACRGLWDVC